MNGDQWAVLIFLQGTTVTTLLAFGPSPLLAYQTNLANTTLELLVPPIGAEPVALQHGAGAVAENLPVWERMPNGQNAAGGGIGTAVFEIPASALLAGQPSRCQQMRSRQGSVCLVLWFFILRTRGVRRGRLHVLLRFSSFVKLLPTGCKWPPLHNIRL
jgi:hypothetical protein